MKTDCSPLTTLLRTDRPVVAINSSIRNHLPALASALHEGVTAIADLNRLGFYEIGIEGKRLYIHIPSSRTHVYLVAALP